MGGLRQWFQAVLKWNKHCFYYLHPNILGAITGREGGGCIHLRFMWIRVLHKSINIKTELNRFSLTTAKSRYISKNGRWVLFIFFTKFADLWRALIRIGYELNVTLIRSLQLVADVQVADLYVPLKSVTEAIQSFFFTPGEACPSVLRSRSVFDRLQLQLP